MTIKNSTILQYITLVIILFVSFTACETDFENIAGDLVDNNVFDIKSKNYEVVSYSENINSSRVDNIDFITSNLGSLNTLGVYKAHENSNEFGLLKASVVAQVVSPTNIDWGDNFNLDAVFLEIPYDATKIENASDGKPQFELNKIYGNTDANYQIQVSRLETYLNLLDPFNPTESNKYYSDRSYVTSTILYPWSNFKPNAKDTVLYLDREILDIATNNYNPIMVEDTIKSSNLNPFIRLPLNTSFFETEFVNNNDQSVFDSFDNFSQFFKGLYIETNGTDGSIMLLNLGTASIKFYYTNTEDKTQNEQDENIDFNGNGTIENIDVTYPVRTKKTMLFPLGSIGKGIKTNVFERDYTGSNAQNPINNPDMINGEKKLYVQGAQGSMSFLDIFNGVDLDVIRDENWLINEASITFYIDKQASTNEVPNRLLLYKVDEDPLNGINENTHILDALTEVSTFNGYLQKESDDDDADVLKYKVNITDYISEILKQEDYIEPAKLGLKLFNTLDIPTSATDKLVEDFSWDPRGVVLYGNKYISTDANYDKRVKLEIFYTEKTN